MNSISQELTRASFTGHPLGAVTTDTFPFDFPSLYPKSNHNVNTKSKSKSPLSHTDQEQSATAVQVETCPHTWGEQHSASEGKSQDPERCRETPPRPGELGTSAGRLVGRGQLREQANTQTVFKAHGLSVSGRPFHWAPSGLWCRRH